MFYRVLKTFKDRYTGQKYFKGQIVEFNDERAREIKGVGRFIVGITNAKADANAEKIVDLDNGKENEPENVTNDGDGEKNDDEVDEIIVENVEKPKQTRKSTKKTRNEG